MLTSRDTSDTNKIIWQNQRSSSSRHSRPIKLEFMPEPIEILQNDANYIDGQIKSLKSTKLFINEQKKAPVKQYFVMTIIDREAINTYTASNHRCNLCGVTAKDFYFKLNYCLCKPIIEERRLLPGLSSLHCWIRFHEWMLN